MELLRTNLKLLNLFSDSDINIILNHYQPLILKADDYFLMQGRLSDRIGFINEGIVRIFCHDEANNEITKHFIAEGEFAVDIESFVQNKMSRNTIQAITPCKIVAIMKKSIDELIVKIPKLQNAFNLISQAALLKKIKDQEIHMQGSGSQKYELFLQDNRHLSTRLPLKFVASYLGITPQSLSRIRKTPK